MKQINRRELGLALSAFGVIAAWPKASNVPDNERTLAHSEIFGYEKLPVKTSANGMTTRSVIRGTLATGEYIEVHETMLPPGEMPHAPHRHTHFEMLLIREGRLEVTSDGRRGFVEPGGVVFTASGVLHGLRNVESVPANYFVVAVGRQEVMS